MPRWLKKFTEKTETLKKITEKPQTKVEKAPDISPGDPPLYKSLRRLSEVQEELEAIRKQFEKSYSQTKSTDSEEILKRMVAQADELKIPGFRAYHLAQEGMALLSLVSVSTSSLTKFNSSLDVPKRFQKIDSLKKCTRDLEPIFHQTLIDMEPYKALDSNMIIESIASKIAKTKE